MSEASSKNPIASGLSLVSTPFKKQESRVKSRVLSVRDKLHATARALLERVRIGLDLPSRSEVTVLADRIQAIATRLEKLEVTRIEDAALVAELRTEAARVGSNAQADVRSGKVREKARTRKPGTASDLRAKKPKKSAAAKKVSKARAKAVPAPKRASSDKSDGR